MSIEYRFGRNVLIVSGKPSPSVSVHLIDGKVVSFAANDDVQWKFVDDGCQRRGDVFVGIVGVFCNGGYATSIFGPKRKTSMEAVIWSDGEAKRMNKVFRCA